MTGYIKAFKPELKIKDYELYKGVYCSECRVLGRLYTPIARLLLSYDFTFLSIVRLALQEKCSPFGNGRCCVNPAKKCLKCTETAELERSADIVVIVSYYKLLDDIADGRFFKRLLCRLIKPVLSLMHRKAAARQEMLDRAVASAMKEQQRVEQSESPSLDEAADPSGKMLAAIFSQGYYSEDKMQLWRFGYLLGRWIYLLDAVDDFEKDVKSGSFNPLKTKFSTADQAESDEFINYASDRLNLTAGETANALDELKFYRFGDIIENVVCDGMLASQTKVLEKKRGRCEE
ncbi:MAG: DUF5685 family protein [Acutalibacteraceae bacterium]